MDRKPKGFGLRCANIKTLQISHRITGIKGALIEKEMGWLMLIVFCGTVNPQIRCNLTIKIGSPGLPSNLFSMDREL
jgi:hypothetical protein